METAKSSFVRAAVSEVIPPGSRINISRLAVTTGLTRKEVASLLQNTTDRKRLLSDKKMLHQRALRVLRGWRFDPTFQRESGKPIDLPMRGEQQSFLLLVKRHGGDVTPNSVLRELERMKSITITRSGKLKLCKPTTRSSLHTIQQMGEFAQLIGDFSKTIQQIVEPRNDALFFGFKDSFVRSPHQAALFQRTFSRRAASLLGGIEQWSAHQTKERSRKRAMAKSKIRVGLGVYLVQGDP